MKRYVALVLTLVLFLFLVSCAAPTQNEIPDLPDEAPSSEIADTAPPQPENNWGITLTLENLTRSGATIVCTQSDGNLTGELNTGSYYIVERLTETGWEEVEQRELEGELAWTAEAWIVNMGGTTKWDVSWEWLYGELPDGHYRIGKSFMNFRGPGDYDSMMIYAEFSFGEMLISE